MECDARGTPQLCSHLWKSHVCSGIWRRARRRGAVCAALSARASTTLWRMPTSTEPVPPAPLGPSDPTAPLGGRPLRSTVSWLLMRFSTQMHAASHRFAGQRSLHPTDVTAMAVLAAARQPLTAGQLAQRLELSTGATTRLIDRLERTGHLTRRADPSDARRRLVTVTDAARATAGAHFGQLGGQVDEVLALFGAEDQAVIEHFLDRLVASMEKLAES